MAYTELGLFEDPDKVHAPNNLNLLREILPSFEITPELEEQVIMYLFRLDSTSPGQTSLSIPERLTCALEASSSGSMQLVAKKHNVHNHSVSRAVRDVFTSLYYIQSGSIEPGVVPDSVIPRISILEEIDKELKVADSIRNHKAMKKALQRSPHVADLVDTFIKFHTPRPILDKYEVPYTPYQVRSVRKFLFGDDIQYPLDGLVPLARRYLFSRWLGENNLYRKPNANQSISRSAIFLFENDWSHLDEGIAGRVRSMKSFLTEMVLSEYRIFRNRSEWHRESYYFPDDYGRPATCLEEISILQTYKAYERDGFCPQSINDFGKACIMSLPEERLKDIKTGQYYSNTFIKNLAWAGEVFLERALVSNHLDSSVFTYNTNEELRKAKANVLRSKSLI